MVSLGWNERRWMDTSQRAPFPVQPALFQTALAYPATRMRGISEAKASAISRLPTLAMQCRAKHMKVGLRLAKSFLMALLIRRISSLLEFTSTEMNK